MTVLYSSRTGLHDSQSRTCILAANVLALAQVRLSVSAVINPAFNSFNISRYGNIILCAWRGGGANPTYEPDLMVQASNLVFGKAGRQSASVKSSGYREGPMGSGSTMPTGSQQRQPEQQLP